MKEESIEQMFLLLSSIDEHLKASNKNTYDWRFEIKECLNELHTELTSIKRGGAE